MHRRDAASSSPTPSPAERCRTVLAAGLVAALAVLPYLGGIDGDWVYDDRPQIVGNHLVLDLAYLGEALASDVWAFHGEKEGSWSNYWRPTFVAWLALSARLFGTSSTVPWHAANLLLHAAAAVLGLAVLRRLGLSLPAAAGAAAVFAVHPAQVESVVWISGSPNALAAVPTLAALLLILGGDGLRSGGRLAAALLLHALALGAKEVSVLFPLLVLVAVATTDRDERTVPGATDGTDSAARRLRRGIRAAVPFVALSAAYFAVRWAVLGRLAIEVPWRMGPLGLVLTLPEVAVFYLRQAFLPLWLGPSYALRAVTPANAGWSNLVLPLGVVAVAATLSIAIARRLPQRLGLASLALLPLLPAFNLNAFIQEQLTHDRYLYLPLLGAWGLAFAALARAPWSDGKTSDRAVWATAAVVVTALAVQTVRYTPVWTSELALWQRGVAVDPGSAFNHAELGRALMETGRHDEALAALDRALAIAPVTTALINRGRLLAEEGRLEPAVDDLEAVIADQPENPDAYEQLAVAFRRHGQLAEAAAVLERGKRGAPHRRCAMSSNLAVIRVLQGDEGAALTELEAALPRVGREQSAACHLVLFHLGRLRAAGGDRAEARALLERYLEISRRSGDPITARARRTTRVLLSAAGASP